MAASASTASQPTSKFEIDFFVKSAHKAISQSINHYQSEIDSSLWNKVWNLNTQDRLKLLLWKVLNNILPTRSLLKNCLSLSESQVNYPICDSEEENVNHLFLNCTFSKVLWRLSPLPLDISKFASIGITKWVECILNPENPLKIPSQQIQQFQLFALLSMDCLWFLRNKIVHDSFSYNLDTFVNGVLKNFKEHCNAWGNKLLNNLRNGKAMPQDHYLLTFDVAVRKNGSTAAAFCRTGEGLVAFVITNFTTSQNPNQGEALALYTGIKEVEAQRIKKVTIGGDSQVVISAIEDPDHCMD
ncbi:uncharacterized protein LOC122312832 [Carya illinoinensis]|uniref:uncharacterized protein LOC122312832 n=1 Tax=Carya illinoinensis TaxID=32201 RepID=UPI001C723081|nr:uncharacterized protein LOC122312832 [Carya illinoinensis]